MTSGWFVALVLAGAALYAASVLFIFSVALYEWRTHRRALGEADQPAGGTAGPGRRPDMVGLAERTCDVVVLADRRRDRCPRGAA